jgi:hypothetical protein
MTDSGWGGGGATIRAGLVLGVAAGALAALSPLGSLVEGPSRETPGVTGTLEPGAVVGAFGVVVGVLLLAAAIVPRLWTQLAGLALATALAGTCGLIVITGRTSDDFAPDAEVTLLGGGRLLTAAFWAGLLAVAVMLVGFRRLALAPRPAADDGEAGEEGEEGEEPGAGGPARPARSSGKATTAVVLGAAGFIVIIASSLAVALGALALGDIRASGGRLGGRGLAVTGMVLGLIALCLLAALVGVGTVAAKPSS